MKYNNLLSFALCLFILTSCQKEPRDQNTENNATQIRTAKNKPNILVIFADDQGTFDTNAYGSKDLETPNLDRIAHEGTRFTQFYAAAPVCSPSRASLMTGKFNHHARLFGNVAPPHADPEFKSGLPTDEITMAEIFKADGYKTGLIGKWHLGHSPEKLPNGQGFDYFFGHQRGCIDNFSHFFFWAGPNMHDLYRNEEEVYYPGQFFGDLMVDEVKKFTAPETEDPFFVYWAINMPHYPYQGRPKWLEHYKDLPSPRREYAAFVSTYDEMIGEVLDHLKATGQLDNTIIVYQSDHGHSTEERAFFGGGNNGVYHGAKFCMLEGGIRVPAMIRYPKAVPANQVRNQMANSIDWLPTLAEITETAIPNKEDIDGKSLIPIIKDKNAPSQHEVLHWATGDPESTTNSWAVRKGNWKLLGNPWDSEKELEFDEDDQLYLVDMAVDSTETTNVAKEHPEVLQELLKLHTDWNEEMIELKHRGE
ncbi:sulfatase family protein [Echinicola vietnamensis]|uniref:Arylsulfatase A family protein n=1 Tax=Echinicola vietnamensis (strain DSM 17526 / LMG 23754 / KMM 6221) TaxID=926556 RepID=L0FWV1_ECHVK|nr:sulfatase-like hydrolase/transferase [Echinicola vietnamensis]AGA78389.1 arylsulfatase A family protein [Echinicola vietnamensis DSM 17526]